MKKREGKGVGKGKIGKAKKVRRKGKKNGGTYTMVRLQIIDLLAEHERPDVFAQELDHVERVGEAGAVAGKPIQHTQQVSHMCLSICPLL